MHRHTLVLASIAGLALSLAPALTSSALAQTTARNAAATRAESAGDVEVVKSDALPIRRLTLYRSGVATVERRGLIDGNATVQLRFGTEQINDILKSMMVLDRSPNGRVAGISYGSKEPLSRRLSSFAVDISGNPSMADLLGALRGSEVTITLSDTKVSGTILGVERRKEADGPAATTLVDVSYINIVTATGLRSVKLSLATGIELKDAELNAELMRALGALSEYRADRTKTVDIRFEGDGGRQVAVAYVQESPVWKTSYRLQLPDTPKKAKDQPKPDASTVPDRFTIQGWAIVENTTDEDWTDVRLSLVSGRPVSFQMDLYEPLYVVRPQVPVPTIPGVAPRVYGAGTDRLAASASSPGVPGSPAPAASKARLRTEVGRSPARAAGSFADAQEPGEMNMAESMAEYAPRAQATAVEAGEVFQFELDHPVTVERQRSAMLPIINAGLDARRVSIFNPSDNSDHPMRGVELKNTTGLELMPGPISVYDAGAYAGDAQIGHVSRGDTRLLAYAVDLDVSWKKDQSWSDSVRKVRIVNGLFELTTIQQNREAYAFTNRDTEKGRTLVVELPRMADFKLVEPAKPSEVTNDLYRFEVELPAKTDANKSSPLVVMQERVSLQQIGLLSLDLPTLLSYSRQGQVPEAVVDAFKSALERQSKVNELERRVAQLEESRKAVFEDQTRIRGNIGSIDRASDLYARYMKTFGEQETQLENLGKDLAATRERLKAAREELDNFVQNLNVG